MSLYNKIGLRLNLSSYKSARNSNCLICIRTANDPYLVYEKGFLGAAKQQIPNAGIVLEQTDSTRTFLFQVWVCETRFYVVNFTG